MGQTQNDLYQRNYQLSQKQQFNFALRIFHEQNSAVSEFLRHHNAFSVDQAILNVQLYHSQVNHLYKYDAVLVLYSVIDRKSFEFARKLLHDMRKEVIINGTNTTGRGSNKYYKRVVILVGNKIDLERSRSVSSAGKS